MQFYITNQANSQVNNKIFLIPDNGGVLICRTLVNGAGMISADVCTSTQRKN
jgi:L-2-hydroxyglutarate oxidase LhgO